VTSGFEQTLWLSVSFLLATRLVCIDSLFLTLTCRPKMADQIPYLPKEVQDALLAGPAMAPPEGVTPDLINPPNNNALAHGVMATCIAVSTFCIILRFYLAVLSRRVKVVECMSDSPTPLTLSVSLCLFRSRFRRLDQALANSFRLAGLILSAFVRRPTHRRPSFWQVLQLTVFCAVGLLFGLGLLRIPNIIPHRLLRSPVECYSREAHRARLCASCRVLLTYHGWCGVP